MPVLPTLRRRGPLAALTIAALASASGLVAASPALAAPAASCVDSQVDIVAHPDDDLLFLSPDLITAITAPGTCVTTAYVTAGNNAEGAEYWQAREAGAKAAYAQMVGVTSPTWSIDDAFLLAGKRVTVATLDQKPSVRLVFFRLNDGGWVGNDYASALRPLDEDTTGTKTVTAIDGSGTTWTKAELTASLTALMVESKAGRVNTQDFTGNYGDAAGDHPDHIAVARFTRAASAQYAPQHTLVSYLDYVTVALPQTTVPADRIALKKAAFFAYAAFDKNSCSTDAACATRDEGSWLERQHAADIQQVHVPAPVVTPTPTQAPTQPAPTQPAAPAAPAAPTTPAAPVVPTVPGEQGSPKAVLTDTTLTSKQFRSSGVAATFTGLTPGKRYQLSYVVGESGALAGPAVVADARGVVSGTWRPDVKAAPALAAPGRFALRISGVETTLSLAKGFTVKDAAAITWKSAHRAGKKVSLVVTATVASATRTSAWKHADVLFQKKVGRTWRTVAVDDANAKGVAAVTVKAGRSAWRAVVSGTGSVWGATSRTVTK